MTNVLSLTYYKKVMQTKTTLFKSMLAGRLQPDFDFNLLKYPVLVSPKLDGIRASVQGGVLLSRNLKPIRNRFTQKHFARPELEGLDGELIFGNPTDKDVYHKTNSAVMSGDGEPLVTYHVFDKPGPEPFEIRLDIAATKARWPRTILVPHAIVEDAKMLLRFEAALVRQGFEGMMIRSRFGSYKQGRSTLNEGYLLKVKRFLDGEAMIFDIEEEMQNTNEGIRQETGKLKRSSHKENMVPKGTAGSLCVRDIKTGVEFNVGSGLDGPLSLEMWNNKSRYIGTIIKYKYFPIGVKDKPRHPIFLGFRDASDISTEE